jgi:hypothetical protein
MVSLVRARMAMRLRFRDVFVRSANPLEGRLMFAGWM